MNISTGFLGMILVLVHKFYKYDNFFIANNFLCITYDYKYTYV